MYEPVKAAAAGDVSGFETFLKENPRCVVSTLAGTANHKDLPIAREFVEPPPELAQRDVDRTRRLLYGELHRLTAHRGGTCRQQNPSDRSAYRHGAHRRQPFQRS